MGDQTKGEHLLQQPPVDKAFFRQLGKSARDGELKKDDKSAIICEQLFQLDEFERAKTVLFYVDAKGEVETRKSISRALRSEKKIIVPYCLNEELHLFCLQDMDELIEGAFHILEPSENLRDLLGKHVAIKDIDFVVVPGLAFDKRGARLGYGIGYFDKLLTGVSPNAFLAALAFESQIFEEIPTQPHDIFMNCIITEETVYRCSKRA